MLGARHLLVGRTLPAVLAAFVALGAGLATSGSVSAQTLQASYPLTANLLDSTTTYGPVSLLGTPPPAGPSAMGVCQNGVYYNSTGGLGQDIRTPAISTLSPTDGQMDVEFNLTALPTNPTFGGPVIVAGTGWRWVGIEIDTVGTVVVLHNNSIRTPSTTTVTPGTWYSASLRWQSGVVQLFLNGTLIQQVTTGLLNDGGDRVITTNNYSVGTALHGCIRNLSIYNNTTLVGGDFQVNSPASSLVMGGLPDAGTFAPMAITTAIGSTVLADLTSTNIGLPWDVAVTTAPAVPGMAGGVPTAGGQFVNVDVTDPSFGALFGLTFTNSFFNLTGLAISFPAPVLLSAQLVVVDPAGPDGIALSHVNQVEFVVCANPENFDAATTGSPGIYPPCWTDGGGTRSWSVHTGSTSSSATGPTGDNTTGSGNYMYCETSAPAILGDTYILNAPPAQPTNGAVQFAYHMYGATMGTLELQELQGGLWTTIWSLSGDQGNTWTTTPLIPLIGSVATLRFVYTRGSSFTGDAAIDDFLLL